MCSLLARVENNRVVKIDGDPDQPFTAGFACTKVNRDAELVHSPERLQTPLRWIGAKGEGRFAPFSWDEALDETAGRWRRVIAEARPFALLGYAYSAHHGQLNRGLVNGLFHALGASWLRADTVCDTCCETAWDLTAGPIGGADPVRVGDADLIVAWGADLVATNVHFWAKAEAARKRGVPIVVIDLRASRTARRLTDWHLAIRIGTDAALALSVMHVLARDWHCDRAYLAAHTKGFERLEVEVRPRFSAVTRRRNYRASGRGHRALRETLRRGEGAVHPARRGHDPAGARRRSAARGRLIARGDRRLSSGRRGAAPDRRLLRTRLRCRAQAFGPGGNPHRQSSAVRRCLARVARSADPRAVFVAANNPAVTCPDAGKVRRGLLREDLFTVVHDPFLSVTARYADIVLPAATYLETEDLYRAYGAYYLQYAPAAIVRQGEAWSNFRLAQALAQRMGLTDPVFRLPPG